MSISARRLWDGAQRELNIVTMTAAHDIQATSSVTASIAGRMQKTVNAKGPPVIIQD
jgi:hypothetical protein